MPFQLIYVSKAKSAMTREQLEALLRTSRANNERAGVTGLLLYRDGAFIQALEGERAAVEQLYATIESDPRHTDVTQLSGRSHEERDFGDWSMGFQRLDDADTGELPDGFSRIMRDDFSPEDLDAPPGFARTVLLNFRTASFPQP